MIIEGCGFGSNQVVYFILKGTEFLKYCWNYSISAHEQIWSNNGDGRMAKMLADTDFIYNRCNGMTMWFRRWVQCKQNGGK